MLSLSFLIPLLTTSLTLTSISASPIRLSRSSVSPHPLRSSPPPTPYGVPVPTPDLLAWTQQEIGVLIHYNIATYTDRDGCNGDPTFVPDALAFNATQIDTNQWFSSISALPISYAILVAKHNCGFTTWPTKVSFPDEGLPVYPYSVSFSSTPTVDVVASFISSANLFSFSTGFYYSVVWNNKLNVENGLVRSEPPTKDQIGITQNTYDRFVLAQLKELWTNYGELDELWFDGGYQVDLIANVSALLNELQPHAAVFNGYGIAGNPVRWITSEDGVAPDPTWSTATKDGAGDPNADTFMPAECDTTLQLNDRWFFSPTVGLRPLAELVSVYHTTVGRNCKLMLDVSPDRRGLVPKEHAELYTAWGQFITSCYGQGSAIVSGNSGGIGNVVVEIVLSYPHTIDRVVIQEDQTNGQLIREYVVEAVLVEEKGRVIEEEVIEGEEAKKQRVHVMHTMSEGHSGRIDSGVYVHLSNGTSVGNKKIDLFAAGPVLISALRLRITQSVVPPTITNFAGHLCQRF